MSLTVEVYDYPGRVVWDDRDHLLREYNKMVQAKMTWDQFRESRFHSEVFFGVVTAAGEWVDSAVDFSTAAELACNAAGIFTDLLTDTIFVLNDLTHSIVHSSTLKRMYEAGLLT